MRTEKKKGTKADGKGRKKKDEQKQEKNQV